MVEHFPAVNRMIIDQIDPQRLVPGGTDTCIHDLVKYGKPGSVGIVGVTSSSTLPLGRWTEIEFATRTIPFMPIARLDRNRNRGFRIPHSLQLMIGLARYRRKIPDGTVQAHRIETGAVLRLFGRKLIVQYIHNDSNGLTGTNSDSLWKYFGPIYRGLEGLVFRSADSVVLFNRTDSERIARRVEKLTVAETWFDPEIFLPNHRTWKMGDEIQLCWIGRFEAQKDPLLAVEVVAELTSLYQDFRLVMVGTGSLKPLLEAEAARLGVADKIEFTGALNRAGVAELMAGSTVLLLTSHYEGSPRVVAEAGATGLPIVATIEADTDRVLERGVNGARVAGREPCGLAHAIMEAAACESQACIARVQHRAAPQAVRRLLGQDESGI